jgi:hypothetical protein
MADSHLKSPTTSVSLKDAGQVVRPSVTFTLHTRLLNFTKLTAEVKLIYPDLTFSLFFNYNLWTALKTCFIHSGIIYSVLPYLANNALYYLDCVFIIRMKGNIVWLFLNASTTKWRKLGTHWLNRSLRVCLQWASSAHILCYSLQLIRNDNHLL